MSFLPRLRNYSVVTALQWHRQYHPPTRAYICRQHVYLQSAVAAFHSHSSNRSKNNTIIHTGVSLNQQGDKKGKLLKKETLAASRKIPTQETENPKWMDQCSTENTYDWNEGGGIFRKKPESTHPTCPHTLKHTTTGYWNAQWNAFPPQNGCDEKCIMPNYLQADCSHGKVLLY